MIGVGGRSTIMEYWHKPEGQSIITGAADISTASLERFKQRINKDAYVTTDYRELLKREDVDAIAILSPDYLHEEHAIAALQAGKHVFCEKPLALYDKQPSTTPFAGRMSVAVGCAATKSIRSGGQVIHIDQGKHKPE